jgi:hypothetical protein
VGQDEFSQHQEDVTHQTKKHKEYEPDFPQKRFQESSLLVA